MNKRDTKHTVLLAMLIISTAIVAVTGFFLKSKLAKKSPTYQDTSVIETPFVLMNNPSDTQFLSNARPNGPSNHVVLVNRDVGRIPMQNFHETPFYTPPVTDEPVAEFGVDESWFDDALFIGDSRMVGVALYGRLGKADYFADVGLNVFSVFDKSLSDDNFGTTNLVSLLDSRTYSKVFIMLGINECGYDHGTIAEEYGDLISKVLTMKPDAKVYILSVYGVSRGKEAQGSYFGPASLTSLNNHLEKLADNRRVFFLDCRSVFEDDYGYIRDEITGDGVHLYGKYADLLSRWLCEQSFA